MPEGIGLWGKRRSTGNKTDTAAAGSVSSSNTPNKGPNNASTFERRGRIRQRTHPTTAVYDEESGNAPVDQSPDSKRRPRRNHAVRRAVFAVLHFVEGEHWQKANAWYQSHKRLVVCIVLAIPFILRPSRTWRWRYLYFGHHNIQGGQIGQYIEKRGYIDRYNEVQAKQKELLDSLGIVMPPAIPPDDYFRVLKFDTQAALREMLVRREQRSRLLANLENQAVSASCSTQQPEINSGTEGSSCYIPPVLFVPTDLPGWYPPRPGKSKFYSKATFNGIEMRQFIVDTSPNLSRLYDSLSDQQSKIYIWAVVSLYYLGGIFVGSLSSTTEDLLDSLLWRPDSMFLSKKHGSPLAVAALQKTDKGRNLDLFVATPRHPALRCTIQQWEEYQSDAHAIFDIFPFSTVDSNQWRKGSLPVDGDDCSLNLMEVHDLDIAITAHGGNAQVFVQQRLAKSVEETSTALTTIIHENNPPPILSKSDKVTLESLLQGKKAEPGWACMRCVKLPQYGQFQKCTKYCSSEDYLDIVCRGNYIPKKSPVPVSVSFKGVAKRYTSGSAIPKVIHQTWFEEVTPDRYPQVTRLQNSWKNSGWEYRLYTDESARQYIAEHYPPRFVDAFDSIIPGAYKADLFRYLVLMREGGIYSDIDILLETNLDSFLTPSLTFFAPRDIPLEFAGEPYCLWNGLIGAAPGHPFIVRAVERLINLIHERADVYDIERDLCKNQDTPLDIWKVRLQTLLLLSGPCGLGVAVNEAQGKPSLQKIDTGWIPLDDLEFGGKKDHGDALILVGDKHDLGGFRLSDPERNRIVASTDFDGLEKKAREISNPMYAERTRQKARVPKELHHYSESNKNRIFVWGSRGVYADKKTTDQWMHFDLQYD